MDSHFKTLSRNLRSILRIETAIWALIICYAVVSILSLLTFTVYLRAKYSLPPESREIMGRFSTFDFWTGVVSPWIGLIGIILVRISKYWMGFILSALVWFSSTINWWRVDLDDAFFAKSFPMAIIGYGIVCVQVVISYKVLLRNYATPNR